MRTDPLRLFMTADAVGGVWTYALDLAGGLAEHGVATTLAVLGPSPAEDQLQAAAQVAGLTLLDTGLPLDWTAASAAQIQAASTTVIDLAADFRADVVHLNSPALAAFGDFSRPVVVACHSCLATWWAAVKSGALPDDFAWRTQLVARGYAAADILVAPTAAFAADTARAYGLPRPPRTVHNGRSPTAGPVASAAVPPGPYVFTAGRLWDEGKNMAALDAATVSLALPVYAAGALTSPAGDRVDLLNLQTLGRLSAAEVSAWMTTATVFAAAPLYEPFGLTVLEAAQARCPLVLSDIPTLRELWDGCAVFASPRDVNGLARAIGDLAADEMRRLQLAASAGERVQQYTVEAMAEAMLGIYVEAVQRAGALA